MASFGWNQWTIRFTGKFQGRVRCGHCLQLRCICAVWRIRSHESSAGKDAGEMNRKLFWTTMLSAIGLGAQATAPPKNVVERVKPRNNECPVCGTFAKKHGATYVMNGYRTCDPNEGSTIDGGKVCFDGRPEFVEHLTRCKFCNAAFWQDAVQ